MTEQQTFKHGFRVDPMKFVEEGEGLPAALVRTQVFKKSKEGDKEIIRSEIDKALAEQNDDGTFGGNSKDTGAKLLHALKLGMAPDRAEARRAAGAILRQVRADENANEWYEHDGEVLSIYALHALCLLGMKDEPEVPRSLRRLVERQDEWNDPWKGCPWTPEVFWSALWAGRRIVPEVEAAVTDGVGRIAEHMNEVGCSAYNHPWGLTDAAGGIDVPEARALVRKQVALILRGQGPDGGWGDASLPVLRALNAHGFLEPLRALPPLPPDWRIAREVRIPEGSWSSLAWDGEGFWAFEKESKDAVALSAADGHEVRRLGIENCNAIAWWDGALAAVGGEPKELRKIDAETGEVLSKLPLEFVEWLNHPAIVGDKVLAADGFEGGVWIVDPGDPDARRFQTLAGPIPWCITPEDGTVWHVDVWAPAIIKSDLEGKLLDWGEKPFGVGGIASDGEHLWALDGKESRICMIEKAGDGC
jgi:hypothetical protein